MSKVSTSGIPATAPSRAAPITPAAGPDAISATGSRRATPAVATPPFELHQVQRDAGAQRLEACVQLLDVGAHDGQERGVERGRRGARVLPALRGDLARQGDRHAGKHRFEDASRLPLVLRVREREEKADRDRLDSSAGEGMRCSLDVARLERLEHLTLRADPAARLAAQLARHQRVGLRAPQVVESRALLRPDLEDVAEAGGREQADARGTALDERVRRRPSSRARGSGSPRRQHRARRPRRRNRLPGRPARS